ncbi:hypothetical protein ACA910_005824 [Epithemia clementina (nom. ined.)]
MSDDHSPTTQDGLPLPGNLRDIQWLANAAQLVLIDSVNPTACGAPVGSSGRFCLAPKLVAPSRATGALPPPDGAKQTTKVLGKRSSSAYQAPTPCQLRS